jgi:hypothetical protein
MRKGWDNDDSDTDTLALHDHDTSVPCCNENVKSSELGIPLDIPLDIR